MWYARPVLFVNDIDRSVEFYVNQLGFTRTGCEEAGRAWVAQVAQAGCELTLTAQWPKKAGKALMFISLDLGAAWTRRDAKDGSWSYRLMLIADPDGNELYFLYPEVSSPGERYEASEDR